MVEGVGAQAPGLDWLVCILVLSCWSCVTPGESFNLSAAMFSPVSWG